MIPPTLREKLDIQVAKVERITRTDLSYLAAGGSWLFFNQAGIAVISFIVSIAFAHFVSKEAYGTYRFLLSVFWILTAFSLTGLPTALSQAVARGFDGTYRRSFRLSLLSSIPLFLIAIGTSIYYFQNGNAMLGSGALVIAVLGPFVQPSLLYGAFLEAKRNFRLMAIFGVALNATGALFLLISMLFTQNPLVFVAAYLLGTILPGIVFYYLTLHLYKPSTHVSPDSTSLSFHFSAMNTLNTLAQQIDKLLIFHYLGAAQLAIYSFAVSIPEQIKAAINSVSTLAFPKFVRRSMFEITQNLWGRLFWFSVALLGVTLAYIVAAPFIFHFIFRPYIESIFFSQLYALSLLFLSNTIPPTILEAHAAKKQLYIFNITSPVVQIAALVILTIMYGIVGAVAARIVSRAFNLLLGTLLVRGYARTNPTQ